MQRSDEKREVYETAKKKFTKLKQQVEKMRAGEVSTQTLLRTTTLHLALIGRFLKTCNKCDVCWTRADMRNMIGAQPLTTECYLDLFPPWTGTV